MFQHAKLGRSHDCMDLRDFYQYYTGRYFAWKNDDDSVTSCCLHPGRDRGVEATYLRKYLPSNTGTMDFNASWKDIKAKGLFGSPVLGNTVFQDTFVYITGHPLRESQKGVGMGGLHFTIPNQYFYLSKFGRNMPELSMAFGGAFGEYSELGLMHNVYNKSFTEFRDAMRILERGEKLGVPISKSLGIHFIEGSPHIHVSYKSQVIGRVVDGVEGHQIRITPDNQWLEQAVALHVPNDVSVRVG